MLHGIVVPSGLVSKEASQTRATFEGLGRVTVTPIIIIMIMLAITMIITTIIVIIVSIILFYFCLLTVPVIETLVIVTTALTAYRIPVLYSPELLTQRNSHP